MVGNEAAETDQEKGRMLLQSFFPQQLTARNPDPPTQGPQLQMPRLTLHEIRHSISQSNPKKSPGIDEIPFLVWQKLWPVVHMHIWFLYEASLRLGHVPRQWKIARIIPLRKPNKPDYTDPAAYRPISLLPTISKGLERVIATRLSWLVETHALLPPNHFGARPRRSCEQALNLLCEKIYEAWEQNRILTLITFDVKGAYNGVSTPVLIKRLRAKGIPEQMVNWIESFCTDRQASIIINGHETETQPLDFPGLPQGSPLAPILYIFVNADLVGTPITERKGAIAFVDDYSRWVTGKSADRNLATIQNKIIPHAIKWAADTRATFDPQKTALIHFARKKTKTPHPQNAIQFMGNSIAPTDQLKLLGVIFDPKLQFKLYITRAVTRGMKQALALNRLKGLRPRAARQLYLATVTPWMDYAPSIWYRPNQQGSVWIAKQFDRVQRSGCRAILGAFRTVALTILEAEAGVDPTHTCLQKALLRHLAQLYTLPQEHPLWPLLRAESNHRPTQNWTSKSPLNILTKTFPEVVREPLEPIEPFCTAPWTRPLSGFIQILEDRGQAIEQAIKLP